MLALKVPGERGYKALGAKRKARNSSPDASWLNYEHPRVNKKMWKIHGFQFGFEDPDMMAVLVYIYVKTSKSGEHIKVLRWYSGLRTWLENHQ